MIVAEVNQHPSQCRRTFSSLHGIVFTTRPIQLINRIVGLPKVFSRLLLILCRFGFLIHLTASRTALLSLSNRHAFASSSENISSFFREQASTRRERMAIIITFIFIILIASLVAAQKIPEVRVRSQSVRQRTTQHAESGIARSIPISGPKSSVQNRKEKITPAYPSPVLFPCIFGVM